MAAEPGSRQTFLPAWMEGANSRSWLQSFRIPNEYAEEFNPDEIRTSTITATAQHSAGARGTFAGSFWGTSGWGIDAKETTRDATAAPPRGTTHGRYTWTTTNAQVDEHMTVLLKHVIRAITQNTPWSPPEWTRDVRRDLLKVALQKFMDKAMDPQCVGTLTKAVLTEASEEDITRELQVACLALMSGQEWSGGDAYRLRTNFKTAESYEAFKQTTLDSAQHRLHVVNSDIGEMEEKLFTAIQAWTHIREGAPETRLRCSEGSRILVQLHSMAINKAHSEKPGEEASPSPSDRRYTTAAAAATTMLPKKHEVIVRLVCGSQTLSSVTVRSKATLSPTRDSLTWPTPASVLLAMPSVLKPGTCDATAKDLYRIQVDINRVPTMCSSGAVEVGSMEVSLVDACFDSIASLDSSLRHTHTSHGAAATATDGAAASGPLSSFNGYHLSQVLLQTPSRSEVLAKSVLPMRCVATCRMHCGHTPHNTPPPRIDVDTEMLRRERRLREGMEDSAWKTDHHVGAFELVGVLGELSDTDTKILRVYCDRFLVHDELERILLLCATATCGRFRDGDTRELMEISLTSLLEQKGTLQTHFTENLVHETLQMVQKQCEDRLIAMEDVTDVAAEAGSLLAATTRLLELLGTKDQDLEALVQQLAAREAQPLAAKVDKIDRALRRDHRPNQRQTVMLAGARASRLVELEQREDREKLVAKARVLAEVVSIVVERCTAALDFAARSDAPLVQAVAQCRVEQIVVQLCPPLKRVVARLLSCLAEFRDADPFGDALGMVVKTFETVMVLCGALDGDPALHRHCVSLVGCFDNFLSFWFPLCEAHTQLWMERIVSSEPLVPIQDGTVHCSNAPGSAKDLIESLYAVFAKILSWSDPQSYPMYSTKFFALVASLSDGFCSVLVAQGRAAASSTNWMVCLANLHTFGANLREFWRDGIEERHLKDFDAVDHLLRHQYKIAAEQARAVLEQSLDDFMAFAQHGCEQWMRAALFNVPLPERDADAVKVLMAARDTQHNRSLVYEVIVEIDRILSHLPATLERQFQPRLVRAWYQAFTDYLLHVADRPLPHAAAQLLGISNVVADVLSSTSAENRKTRMSRASLANPVAPAPVDPRARNARVLAMLIAESSTVLIQMLTQDELDREARGRVVAVLRCRKDKEAKRFVQQYRDDDDA